MARQQLHSSFKRTRQLEYQDGGTVLTVVEHEGNQYIECWSFEGNKYITAVGVKKKFNVANDMKAFDGRMAPDRPSLCYHATRAADKWGKVYDPGIMIKDPAKIVNSPAAEYTGALAYVDLTTCYTTIIEENEEVIRHGVFNMDGEGEFAFGITPAGTITHARSKWNVHCKYDPNHHNYLHARHFYTKRLTKDMSRRDVKQITNILIGKAQGLRSKSTMGAALSLREWIVEGVDANGTKVRLAKEEAIMPTKFPIRSDPTTKLDNLKMAALYIHFLSRQKSEKLMEIAARYGGDTLSWRTDGGFIQFDNVDKFKEFMSDDEVIKLKVHEDVSYGDTLQLVDLDTYTLTFNGVVIRRRGPGGRVTKEQDWRFIIDDVRAVKRILNPKRPISTRQIVMEKSTTPIEYYNCAARCGKTTLIGKMAPELIKKGFKVGLMAFGMQNIQALKGEHFKGGVVRHLKQNVISQADRESIALRGDSGIAGVNLGNETFDFVFLDEQQDSSAKSIQALSKRVKHKIYVFGDVMQNIYAHSQFAGEGLTPENIGEYFTDYTVIQFKQAWTTPANIVRGLNKVFDNFGYSTHSTVEAKLECSDEVDKDYIHLCYGRSLTREAKTKWNKNSSTYGTFKGLDSPKIAITLTPLKAEAAFSPLKHNKASYVMVTRATEAIRFTNPDEVLFYKGKEQITARMFIEMCKLPTKTAREAAHEV